MSWECRDAEPIAYEHVQRGWFHIVLHAVALLVVAVTVLANEGTEPIAVGLAAGAFLEVVALSFSHLQLADRGDHLLVAFGPLKILRRRVRYAELVNVQRSRTLLLEGWGIHWVPTRGWIWNIYGRDCVRLELTGKRFLTLGTDDADALAAFLEGQLAV